MACRSPQPARYRGTPAHRLSTACCQVALINPTGPHSTWCTVINETRCISLDPLFLQQARPRAEATERPLLWPGPALPDPRVVCTFNRQRCCPGIDPLSTLRCPACWAAHPSPTNLAHPVQLSPYLALCGAVIAPLSSLPSYLLGRRAWPARLVACCSTGRTHPS